MWLLSLKQHDYTPLHHACTRRDTGKIVALLLSHGADVDAMDSMVRPGKYIPSS